MLELSDWTKKYGEKVALNHLSVRFETGVYGLLGANGAGKSTMLNLITDNIPRTEGQILWDGKEILTMKRAYFKQLGYTPQLQGMYEDFTARDFLHYIGSLKGMKAKECKKQTEEFLDVVCLSDDAHHRLGSFSGGMRQRVLLAAAMLDNPKLLILDEPTAGLDPTQRIRLRDYIASISSERTVLLATHVISDVETIAKKVLILSKGTLRRFDTPQRLMEEARTLMLEEGQTPPEFLTLEDVYLFHAKETLSWD